MLLLPNPFHSLQAQQTTVTIKVSGPKIGPLSYASSSLTSISQSALKITSTAYSSGIARFTIPVSGQYKVKVSSANYLPLEKGITVSSISVYVRKMKTMMNLLPNRPVDDQVFC
jgi:hypothetical protein